MGHQGTTGAISSGIRVILKFSDTVAPLYLAFLQYITQLEREMSFSWKTEGGYFSSITKTCQASAKNVKKKKRLGQLLGVPLFLLTTNQMTQHFIADIEKEADLTSPKV